MIEVCRICYGWVIIGVYEREGVGLELVIFVGLINWLFKGWSD